MGKRMGKAQKRSNQTGFNGASTLRTGLVKRYTPMYQQLLGPNGKVEVTDTPSESQLFSAMIWQESGGNQYGKDGSPLVSPKGAVGVAQVMEDTGPEAASGWCGVGS
jgi:hypothetical protein